MTEIKQDDPDTKLDRTFNILRQHASQALILDLEFYNTSDNHQRIKQIAGIVLGQTIKPSAFNGFIFDPDNMNSDQQLDFFKNHNITYQQALKCSSSNIMKQVKNFINAHHIDTIVSWGNSLDFSELKSEGYSNIIPGEMNTIDLEAVFEQLNKRQDVSLNLANYCRLLNLKNTGKWHDALDDSRMIKQICNLYLNVLTEPLDAQVNSSQTIDFLSDPNERS